MGPRQSDAAHTTEVLIVRVMVTETENEEFASRASEFKSVGSVTGNLLLGFMQVADVS